MKLCRVIGNCVASAQHPAYDGRKLMLVQPIQPNGAPVGRSFLAVDRIDAGPGDRVLVMREGSGIRQLLGTDAGPIRSLIATVVDDVCEQIAPSAM